MRLKRTLNRRVEGKPYYKWLLADVPPATVEALGWSEGDELRAEAKGDSLVIRRMK